MVERLLAEGDDEVEPLSFDELSHLANFADDKERLIGLVAAPVAALVGLVVTTALVDDDPPALLKNGLANVHHVSLSLYYDLGAVMLGLSVLMLVTAILRKRLFLGMAMALYGLAVFNLHFWGFGVPFIPAAAWYLVRSYRLQRDFRMATGDAESTCSHSGNTRVATR